MVYGKTVTEDEALIEDTIQELFLTFWKKKDTIFIQSSLDTYLFVAFRNNLIRRLKSKAQQRLEINLPKAEGQPSEILLQKEEQLKTLLEKTPASAKRSPLFALLSRQILSGDFRNLGHQLSSGPQLLLPCSQVFEEKHEASLFHCSFYYHLVLSHKKIKKLPSKGYKTYQAYSYL